MHFMSFGSGISAAHLSFKVVYICMTPDPSRQIVDTSSQIICHSTGSRQGTLSYCQNAMAHFCPGIQPATRDLST